MKKVEIEFHNYKLLKDKKFVLEGSNIYLILGGNEQGKTSFIKGLGTLLKAENKTTEPVTQGEKDGHIIGDITMADGKVYTVKFDFSNVEKDKFTLIYPDGTTSKKVSDIRDLFQFNDFTADDFLAWGKTAEGKRKQKMMVLGVLPIEVQKQFAKLEMDEKNYYDQRATANAERAVLAKISPKAKVLTEEEKQAVNDLPAYVKRLEELRIELVNSGKVQLYNNGIDNIIDTLHNQCYQALEYLTIAEDKQVLEKATNTFIDTLNKYRKKGDTAEVINEKIKAGEGIIKTTETLQTEVTTSIANVESLKKMDVKCQELDEKVKSTRVAKEKLITDAKLPFEDISFAEDGLLIKTPNGNLPFNDDQVSTSRVMKLTIKLIALLNKKCPVVFIGRAESFSEKSQEEMYRFAEEIGATLFFDKVIEEEKEINVIGYEYKAKYPIEIKAKEETAKVIEKKGAGDERPPVDIKGAMPNRGIPSIPEKVEPKEEVKPAAANLFE